MELERPVSTLFYAFNELEIGLFGSFRKYLG